MSRTVTLTGSSLTLDEVVAVARDGAKVAIAPEAARRAAERRGLLEAAIARGETIYGVNTGFGRLASVRIPPEQLAQLQANLIRSHAAGVGAPLPTDAVRALMVLRANALLQPTSAVRPLLPERLVEMLNRRRHPRVPEQGSVGASGDLAPLAHLALCLMGEGEYLDDGDGPQLSGDTGRTAAESRGETGEVEPALAFQAKEGLSFINGTQAQAALLALLVHDARVLWRTAHGAAAMSLEAVRGTPTPFDERIHALRPHPAQQASARLMAALLEHSEIRESHRHDDPRVQDAYSLRCVPQVLGAAGEAIRFAGALAATELNAATDNPLMMEDGTLLSGGNFHGQPLALALDVLGIGLATLAGIAERRIERLVNADLSSGLPPFLVANAGLESGYMMAQVTAAALVAECRSLAHPASVESIPTGGSQEDFVPMGMAAAFKARRILTNAQRVVAAELVCAAQGLEFLKPLAPGRGVGGLCRSLREGGVRPLEGDRVIARDLDLAAELVASGRLDPVAHGIGREEDP